MNIISYGMPKTFESIPEAGVFIVPGNKDGNSLVCVKGYHIGEGEERKYYYVVLDSCRGYEKGFGLMEASAMMEPILYFLESAHVSIAPHRQLVGSTRYESPSSPGAGCIWICDEGHLLTVNDGKSMFGLAFVNLKTGEITYSLNGDAILIRKWALAIEHQGEDASILDVPFD